MIWIAMICFSIGFVGGAAWAGLGWKDKEYEQTFDKCKTCPLVGFET